MFAGGFLFWKTFQQPKNRNHHIISAKHFCFGQLFENVENFSCQKVCTIEIFVVILHRISAHEKAALKCRNSSCLH